MGMYSRYKKAPDGFRKLVELLETTPLRRRQQLIDAGMKEDEPYTKAAVEHILTFKEITQLPSMELTEVLAKMKPRNVAYAVFDLDEDVKSRVLGCVQRNRESEVRSYIDILPTPQEIGQSRKEAIEVARKLEQQGLLSIKRIPKNFTVAGKKDNKERTKMKENVISLHSEDIFSTGKDLFTEDLFGDDTFDTFGDSDEKEEKD